MEKESQRSRKTQSLRVDRVLLVLEGKEDFLIVIMVGSGEESIQ